MNEGLDFEETRVSFGLVFSLPLSLVPKLKECILDDIKDLPEVRPVYQRVSPGRLRIEAEEADLQ